MVDTWQPNTSFPSLTAAQLSELASSGLYPLESPLTPISALTNEQKDSVTSWLKTTEEQWLNVIPELSPEILTYLCALFTVGEQQLSEWQCGKRNPTILILRHLKGRNAAPEKDFIRWLKKQTDNRYIPYGDALS